MTLSDYILTYKEDGKIKANLFDYYEYFIRDLDNRFKQYSYYDNKLVLCWFTDHQDVNPSMGWIRDRYHKGVYLYHCFGCGRTGNVIRLNQLISSQYHNKELSEKESCLDLALKFNIPLDDFDELEDDDFEGQYLRNLKRIDRLTERYTVNEFKKALLTERKSGNIDLDKINSECIKMIATKKLLYD